MRHTDKICLVGQNSYICSVVIFPQKDENSFITIGSALRITSGLSIIMVVCGVHPKLSPTLSVLFPYQQDMNLALSKTLCLTLI